MPELLAEPAGAVDAASARVQLYACGFGAGTPQVFSGSMLLPAGIRLSDYCNLDDPVLLLQARAEGSATRFALAKEGLDAIWTLQSQATRSDLYGQLEVTPVRVHVQTRLLDVVGTLHVAPGADPLEMLMRGSRRFVALSQARVSVPGKAPRLDTGLGVCLVNRVYVVAAELDRPKTKTASAEPAA